MGKIRVADFIVKRLTKIEGVDYIFGITGKSISAIVDACWNFDSIEYITTRHEAGAAYMAFGYAQSTGKIGVCLGTSGGGATNMTTGIASAYMNSVPMIAFSGQVPIANFGKGAFQESTGIGRTVNVVDIFKPMTKASFSIEHPKLVPKMMEYAIKQALTGRQGPVHISIPIDVQMAEIDDEITVGVKPEFSAPLSLMGNGVFSEALQLINESERPVLLAGWGAVMARAEEEVLEFAERLNVPFMTTPQAKGSLPANHPLYLGMMGLGGHKTTVEYLANSDLLIAVGTTFNEFATLNWNPGFEKVKKVIQVDIDPTEIDKNLIADVAIVADAKATFALFNQQVETDNAKILAPDFHDIREKYRLDKPEKQHDKSTPIKPQRLIFEIRENTPNNTIFLADSGAHCIWALGYLDIYRGGNFYAAFGFGAMGVTVAASMGIQLAHPGQAVISIVGDGTLMMHLSELAVAKQFDIPVIWIVMNDSSYAMPVQGAKHVYGRSVGTTLSDVDFAKAAESFGIAGYTVTEPDKVGDILNHHISVKEPAVIDVLIDRTEIPSMGARISFSEEK